MILLAKQSAVLALLLCLTGCGGEQPMFKAGATPRIQMSVKLATGLATQATEPLIVPEDKAGKTYLNFPLHVDKRPILTSADIAGTSVEASKHAEYGWLVKIFLSKPATEKFAAFTLKNEGLWTVLYLDDQYEMTLHIGDPITDGIAVIQGKFSEAQAMNLAKGLVGQ